MSLWRVVGEHLGMQGNERVDEPIAGGQSKEVNLMSFQCVRCISIEVGRVSRKRFIIIYL